MKKGMIISVIGLFIIATVIICSNGKGKTYEKRKHFATPEEIVNVLSKEPLSAYDEKHDYKAKVIYSDTFLECLSNRKRIAGPNVDLADLNLKLDEERNTEEVKKIIIDDYLTKGRNLKNFKNPDKIEAVALKGEGVQYPVYQGTADRKVSININAVLIDEGEGWVIDYFMYSNNEQEPNYASS